AVGWLAQNRKGLLATVGEITASPGASNVIPGEVRLSLDVRQTNDRWRVQAVRELRKRAKEIAVGRGVEFDWQIVQETAAVNSDPRLSKMLAQAIKPHQDVVQLPSGAGHDAAIMAGITPM